MKKKNKTYRDYLREIRKTKEELPLHKMDEISRRHFIQSAGAFLGGLLIPSVIRLETMSTLSKKILGSSTAFAQGFGSQPLDIQVYVRAGFQSTSIIGMYGHDVLTATDANMPWVNSSITPTATSRGTNVMFTPTSLTPLGAFANSIQHITGDSNTGHTEYFQSTQRQGMGELLSLRAATEDNAGYKPLLSTPFVFGNNQSVALQDVPASLSAFTPIMFSSIASAYQQFSPLALTTNQGTNLSSALRDTLLGIVGSKFENDITKGVLQKDVELVKSSGSQTLKILKTNYADALNPANDATTVNAIGAGLGSLGRLSFSGYNNAPQAMYVLIKQAILGVGPMTGAMIVGAGDWHNFNALASGDGGTDLRKVSGQYLATLFGNVLTLANAGTWKNPNGGDLEIRIHLHSEFGRTILLGGAANDDNGDGQSDYSLVMGSNPSQTDFKPGCFGGTNATGQQVGFNPSTNAHSSNIALASPDLMFGHKLNLMRIKKDLFNLKDFEGFAGNMA